VFHDSNCWVDTEPSTLTEVFHFFLFEPSGCDVDSLSFFFLFFGFPPPVPTCAVCVPAPCVASGPCVAATP